MAVVVRLRGQGATNRVMYRVVVTDGRRKRDGKYIECLGTYNPFASGEQKKIELKADRLQHWIENGAQISERVESLTKEAAPEVITVLQARRAKQIVKRRRGGKKKK